MLELRKMKEEDYPIIAKWWEDYGYNAIPYTLLPQTSAVAWDEKGMIAASWAYLDNSCGFASLAWPVTNPERAAFDKEEALDAIFTFIERMVKDLDYAFLMGFSSVGSITKLFEKHGLTMVDENVTFSGKGLI